AGAQARVGGPGLAARVLIVDVEPRVQPVRMRERERRFGELHRAGLAAAEELCRLADRPWQPRHACSVSLLRSGDAPAAARIRSSRRSRPSLTASPDQSRCFAAETRLRQRGFARGGGAAPRSRPLLISLAALQRK